MHIQVWEALGWVISFLLPGKSNALKAENAWPTSLRRKETAPKRKTLFPCKQAQREFNKRVGVECETKGPSLVTAGI